MKAGLIFILLWIIFVSLANPSWNNPFSIYDSWYYYSFAKNFPEHFVRFQDYYFVERIGVILPKLLTQHLFSAEIEFYFKRIIITILSGSLFLFLLKKLFNLRTAFITTFILINYGHFLHAMGHDYLDGIAFLYVSIIMILLIKVSKNVNRYLVSFIGFIFVWLLSVNLFLIVFWPSILIMWFFISNKPVTKSLLVHISKWLLLGGLISYVSIHSILKFIGIETYFPLLQTGVTENLLTNTMRDWSRLLISYWLLMPTVLAIISILLLKDTFSFRKSVRDKSFFKNLELKYKSAKFKKNYHGFLLTFLTTYGIYCIYQIFFEGKVLQLWYYVTLLLPWIFLAIGALLKNPLEKLSFQQYKLTLISLVFLALITHLYFTFGSYWNNQIYNAIRIFLLILASISLGVFLIKKFQFKFFYLSLITAFAFMLTAFVPYYPPLKNLQNPNQAQVYVLVDNAMNYINNFQNYGTMKFWYNKNEPFPYANTYQAITSTYLWDRSLAGLEYPSGLKADILGNNTVLFILTSVPVLDSTARIEIKQFGYDFETLDVKEFKEEFVNFYIITGQLI